SARRAFPCRPSAVSAIVESPASGVSAAGDRLQRRTAWPARARSAAVAKAPLPPPRIAMFTGWSRDRTSGAQLGDLHVRVLEHFGEDLVGLLAQTRGRTHLETHRAVHLDGRAERPGLAVERVIHGDDHPTLDHLLIGQDAIDG